MVLMLSGLCRWVPRPSYRKWRLCWTYSCKHVASCHCSPPMDAAALRRRSFARR